MDGLDTESLRVALGLVTATLAVLFRWVTYRVHHSRYSLWWSRSLAMYLAGALVYLAFVPGERPWVVPVGNALLVGGATMTWCAARAFGARSQPVAPVVALPAAAALAAALDDPAADVWAGGTVFLVAVTLAFAASGAELLRARVADTTSARWLGVAASTMGAYYAARLVVFVAQGPDGPVFEQWLSSGPTTLLNIVFLVLVSFTMSAMATASSLDDLRRRATHDGLTGLLDRVAFHEEAAERLERGPDGAIVAVDIDHFKAVNDQHGHAAGDAALVAFAAACRRHLPPGALAARLGGEEFAFLLPGCRPHEAVAIAEQIRLTLRGAELYGGIPMPTASFGVAAAGPGRPFELQLADADRALYVAKLEGRDRVVLDPRSAPSVEG